MVNEPAETVDFGRAPAAPSAEPWPHGHRIGMFELRAVVARSAAAVVYRGWDHELARPVAIKEYLPQRLARRSSNGSLLAVDESLTPLFEQGLQGFLDEARTLAHCNHPALVQVLHLVQAYGSAYRVMPWYVGSSLAEVRRGMSNPPNEAALRVLIDEVLGALDAYHRVGGVHGGLSSQQILMLEDDHALLLGPGADRASSWRPQGPWVDLRALADTVRACMTGAPPSVYSESLQRALAAATSADVDERPQTVAQFRALLAGEPAVARPAAAPDVDVDDDVASLIGRVIDSIPAPARAPFAPPPAFARAPVPRPAPVHAHAPMPPAAPAAPHFVPEFSASLPATGAAPRRPELRERFAEPLFDDDEIDVPAPALPQRQPRARRVLGWSAAAVIVAVAGYVGWQSWVDSLFADRLASLAGFPPVTHNAASPAGPTQSAGVVDLAPAAPVASPGPAAAAPAPSQAEPAPPAESKVAPPAPAARAPTPKAAAPRPRPTTTAAKPTPTTGPRALCGARTDFALYRCMQQQCARAQWQHHPQCLRLKAYDSAD